MEPNPYQAPRVDNSDVDRSKPLDHHPGIRSTVIWYASDQRARSCLKLLVYDDRGSLTLQGRSLVFAGLRGACSIDRISTVTLSRQTPNWPVHATCAGLLLVLLMARGLSLLMAAPVVLVTVVVALAIGGATQWVRVTYRTTAGEESAAWFADGSSFGWSGLSGGTERLYELIRARTIASDHDSQGELQTCEPVILGPSPLAARGPVEETCPWCESRVVPDADGRCPSCNRPIA